MTFFRRKYVIKAGIIFAPLSVSPTTLFQHIRRASTEIENETACRRVLSENGRKKNEQGGISYLPLEVHFLAASARLLGHSENLRVPGYRRAPRERFVDFQTEIVFTTGKRTSCIILCCEAARTVAHETAPEKVPSLGELDSRMFRDNFPRDRYVAIGELACAEATNIKFISGDNFFYALPLVFKWRGCNGVGEYSVMNTM